MTDRNYFREYCSDFVNKLFEFDKNCYTYKTDDDNILKAVILCGVDITKEMINKENINRIYEQYAFKHSPLSLAISLKRYKKAIFLV